MLGVTVCRALGGWLAESLSLSAFIFEVHFPFLEGKMRKEGAGGSFPLKAKPDFWGGGSREKL